MCLKSRPASLAEFTLMTVAINEKKNVRATCLSHARWEKCPFPPLLVLSTTAGDRITFRAAAGRSDDDGHDDDDDVQFSPPSSPDHLRRAAPKQARRRPLLGLGDEADGDARQ